MLRHLACWSAILIALAPVAAYAGPVADAAARAEDLMAQSKFVEALDALDAAKEEVWKQAPMTFRKALFAAADPTAFGVYDIKEGTTFKRQELLIIYAEPVGYGYGRDGDFYLISLALDFTVKDRDGKVIAKQENFGTLNFRSRFPNKEFMTKVTYNFSGLPAGDYEVVTTARDQNSPKSAEFSLKFTLVD
jgi:hypothetical protein